MIILAFIGFLLIIIVIGICVFDKMDEGNTALAIFLLGVAGLGLSFIMTYMSYTPTALDVYKGKTELKITYECKISVDSVVIYKKGGGQ